MKLGAIFRGLSTAVMMLFMIGGMILYLTTGDMIVSFKPAVSFEDMLDENSEGMKAGQHVKGNVKYVLDYFASESTYTKRSDGSRSASKKSGNYYLLPTAEGYIGLKSREKDVSILNKLTEETYTYLTTGEEPVTEFFIEGHVKKLKGNVVRYYKEYLEEFGYTESEIEAMGDPLVIEYASFGAVRIMFVIGVLILILGVLLFRRGYRLEIQGSGLPKAEDLP